MLAKVIASGETRDVAIARLVSALRDYPILGVRTNIPFLIKVLEHPRFRAGDVDTGFLDRERDTFTSGSNGELPAFLRQALLQVDEAAGPFDVAQGRPEPGAQGLKPGGAGIAGENDPWIRLQGWRA